MNTQETLTRAMLNRKAISFKYARMGKVCGEEIGNAHVIFISNTMGKNTVMANVAQDEGKMPSWKNFDISSMFNVQIVGDEQMMSAH